METDGNKNELNAEAQENFKLKLRNFQAKVKTTLDSLVKERNELKERVKELEHLLNKVEIGKNSGNNTDGSSGLTPVEIEVLREQLADQANELEELRLQLADLQEEKDMLKETLDAEREAMQEKTRNYEKQEEIYKQEIQNLTAKLEEAVVKSPRGKPSESLSSPTQHAHSSNNWARASATIGTKRLSSRPQEGSEEDAFDRKAVATANRSATEPQINIALMNPSPSRKTSPPEVQSSNRKQLQHSTSMEDLSDEEGDDIVIVRDSKSNEPEVKAGTLKTLVERLSYHKAVDTDYVTAFLLTYRSFTTPMQLFELLKQRYLEDIPPNKSPEETKRWEEKQKIIKLRVGNVLKSWLGGYYSDFAENPELLKAATEFVNGPLCKDLEALSTILKKLLVNENSRLVKSESEEPPPPILPKGLNFLQFEPLEVARQICIIEHELYRAIRPEECLNLAWSKKDRDIRSANIVAIVKRFNLVSGWVATEVVKRENLKERVSTIKNFIKIAQECRNLGNFNAQLEILSGLQNSAIYRLKKTWEKVESSKINEVYQALMKDISSEGNYKTYRNLLHTTPPPCIPYLGVYLTDLTFIEDGNPDFIRRESKDLVNFDKRRKVSLVIREIQQYQSTPYNLKKEETIRKYLDDVQTLTEKALYKYSLICEPRGGRRTQGTLSNKLLFRKFRFDDSS